ncbi:SH3 domain-containing protein [Roseicella sp. DB1501]|uniref:SH3 domain-containing protein n=1 Tax=Roseicella sp. DB1501 TaxID=2730925 RepID=UPI001490CEC6|nr:SH3 domain-containing protein [Roseicella sp. DB1501]NOG72105.1 SH3 domain-containing protein [Roseicella sp. DB1501]
MVQQHDSLYDLDKPGPDGATPPPSPPRPPALVLPPGWVGLERCNLSPVPGQTVAVRHVLLHPFVGIALIDIAPDAAHGAEPALRARLDAAHFSAIFPGHLPVVHLQVTPQELRLLDTILPAAFANLPPISLPGGDGWVSVVRRALTPRSPGRGPSPAAPGRAGRAPMLNREVAAQRVGLPPASVRLPMQPYGAGGSRRSGLLVALALGSVAAVTAAVAVLWGGTPATEPAPAPLAAAPAPQAATPPGATLGASQGTTQGTTQAGAPGIASAPSSAGGAATNPATATAPAAPTGPAPAAERPATAAATPAPAPAPFPAQALRDRAPAPAAPAREQLATAAPAETAGPGWVTPRTGTNLRTAPNNRASVLRTVPAGEVMQELERSADGWVHVSNARSQGWMFGKFLVPAKP